MKKFKKMNILAFLLFAMIPFLPVSAFVVDEGASGDNKEKQLLTSIEAKVKEVLTKDLDEVNKAIEWLKNEIKTNSQVGEMTQFKELQGKLEARLTELKEQSDKQGTEITKLFNIGGKHSEKKETLTDVISETLKTEEISDFMRKRKGSTNQVELKIVGDMTEAGNLTAGSILITDQPRRDIIELKTRPIHMRDIMSIGTTEKDRIPVVKQANFEDGADMKAENTSSTESDFDLVETYVNVERLCTHMIVSKDLLDDVPALTSFISNHMPKRVKTKEDQQILFGNGSTPQIQGITGVATAFAAGSFATSIPAANEIDVIRVALANLNVSFYSPSAILMHPTDVAIIDTLKTSSTREYLGNNYLVSRDSSTGLMSIAGIPIIQNTAMTAGYFCIGDFADAAEIVDRKKLTMQMSDSHSDYFIKNMICITFEERIALPIYYNGAFCYGQFSVAKAAITSGS